MLSSKRNMEIYYQTSINTGTISPAATTTSTTAAADPATTAAAEAQ